MKVIEKLDDQIKRMEIQKSWNSRIDNYHSSRAAFCDKHGLSKSTLCRLLKFTYAAGWNTIEKVETALKSENL